MTEPDCTVEVQLSDPSGLHARPAAALVETAAAFKSQAWLATEEKSVELTSMVNVLALGISGNTTVTLRARGPDAAGACDALADILRTTSATEPAPRASESATAPLWRARLVAVGIASIGDPIDALAKVADDLRQQAADADGETTAILKGLSAMARDPILEDRLQAALAQGHPTTQAVAEAFEHFAGDIGNSGDDYIAARAEDIIHLRDAVLTYLEGRTKTIEMPDHPVVLVADDLSPSDVARLDTDHIYGLILKTAGPTSHSVMVARSRGIPAVVGDAAHDLEDGTVVTIDPTTGAVEQAADQTVPPAKGSPIVFPSDTPPTKLPTLPVSLSANVGSVVDATRARLAGAASIGLYRTELAFLAHDLLPTVNELDSDLAAIQEAFGHGLVTVRTFDFGADKTPGFMSWKPEPNPSLGVRGLRLYAEHDEMFDRQLEAVRRASTRGPIAVMAPMVANWEEAAWFGRQVRSKCSSSVEVGVMIEIPSAVFDIQRIAAEVDFVSVGTNDLAQYLFAADRHIERLQTICDPFSPPLLRALAKITREAGPERPVSVCGAAAGDPAWARLAAGLGVTGLSMDPAQLQAVASALARWTQPQNSAIAQKALHANDVTSVRSLLE